VMLTKAAWDYLSQDSGGWIERIRQGEEGAALGFAALDNEQMYVTGNPEYPAEYQTSFAAEGEKAERQQLHRSQFIRIVDCPSPQEQMLGVGFCAVSRAMTTARVLMDIVRYEREKLSDLPPAGLLLLNNMAQDQWKDLQTNYDTRQEQRGNQIWRQVMVAFGLDPAQPLSAELFQFSNLPEAFDRKTMTEIAVYSFALAFRIDPREIWPVSSGTLGTASEAEIMHVKARAKGAGLVLTQIERALNDGYSLPANVTFTFDYQDTEEDVQSIQIAQGKAEFISALSAGGLVDRDEARAWLVREGLFEEEDLAVPTDEGRAEDVAAAKALAPYRVDLGPRVRAYRDGRTVRLEAQARHWFVPDLALKTAAENYAAGRIDTEDLARFAIDVAVEARA